MIVRERYMRLIRDYMDKPVIKIITGMRRNGKALSWSLRVRSCSTAVLTGRTSFSSTLNPCAMRRSGTIRRCTQRSSKSLDRQKDGSTSFSMKSRSEHLGAGHKFLRVDLDCDIYVTGSNAKLLSGELATAVGWAVCGDTGLSAGF